MIPPVFYVKGGRHTYVLHGDVAICGIYRKALDSNSASEAEILGSESVLVALVIMVVDNGVGDVLNLVLENFDQTMDRVSPNHDERDQSQETTDVSFKIVLSFPSQSYFLTENVDLADHLRERETCFFLDHL